MTSISVPVALFCLGLSAGPPAPAASPGTTLPDARVSIVMGSVLVPSGSVSYRTGGSVDYFLGYLQVSRPPMRVLYSVGMVGHSPRNLQAKGYRWLKQEHLSGGDVLTYGERLAGPARVIDANIGLANFSVVPVTEAEIQAFLAIVRTYGACQSCPPPLRGAT